MHTLKKKKKQLWSCKAFLTESLDSPRFCRGVCATDAQLRHLPKSRALHSPPSYVCRVPLSPSPVPPCLSRRVLPGPRFSPQFPLSQRAPPPLSLLLLRLLSC